MKMTRLRLWPGFILLFLSVLSVAAQLPVALHTFTNSPDGSGPESLTLTNGILYGATQYGGTTYNGTIFSISTNGNGYNILREFSGDPIDGSAPNDVAVSGATVYGTTRFGGTLNYNAGTIYKVGADGNNFAVLRSFTNTDGANPLAGLILSGTNLYGTTYLGGTNGNGTIFRIGTNGMNFTVLHNFTNSVNGANPIGFLMQRSATVYGVTAHGGAFGNGTVYKMNTNGSAFTVIHNFTNTPDGASPATGVLLVSNLLYGTTQFGGAHSAGIIFKMTTNGANYQILASFDSLGDNTNGSQSLAQLFFTRGLLFGGTGSGGISNAGVIFQLSTNGSNYRILRSFTGGSGSSVSSGSLFATDTNTLYIPAFGQNNSSDSGLILKLFVGRPGISQQPQATGGATNQPVSLSVAADGAGILSYQWRFNTNTVVAGGTGSTLTFTSPATNQSGKYSVIISNFIGSVTSSYALLTITNPPPVVIIPSPAISSCTYNPANDSFSIQGTNSPQCTNYLLVTTNLADPASWRPIATNVTSGSGAWSFVDTNSGATNSMRFYRISSP